MITHAMLAKTLEDPGTLTYPVYLTPKVDGIRALKVNGCLLTRSFKLVRNEHIQHCLRNLPDGLDGELVVGDNFQSTTSGVMRVHGQPNFQYLVFDYAPDLSTPYWQRMYNLLDAIKGCPYAQPLVPWQADDVSEFLFYEEQCLSNGYEGVMVRDPHGEYECRRSHLLLKWKRTVTAEAKIVAFKEAMENTNPIVRNQFGRAKRPGGSEGKEPKGTLGSFILSDGTSVGTGMDDALRQHVWDNPLAYIGRTVEYAYQEHGVKNKPRFPRFVRFRDDK